MGFMSSYKRLDNLCKDMNGIGVTGYIEDMDRNPNGAYHVHGWKDDYYQLKHYRYIRNQIAHENYASEDTMCSDEDEVWIENFYQRIMVQSDPLALYRKAITPRPVSKPTLPKTPQNSQYIPSYSNTNTPESKPFGRSIITLLAVAGIILLIFFLLLNNNF